MASLFRNIILFFDKLGIYDVVLPFLLIFTIVFAMLEKTRVLGFDDIGGVKHPKRNLNSMVAFVIAFLVVASTKLVAVINEAAANITLFMLIAVFALMLLGFFFKPEEDGFYLDYKQFGPSFFVVIAIGVGLVFLYALDWINPFLKWLSKYWQTDAVASIILILFIVLFIKWITKPVSDEPKEGKDD